MTDFTEDDIAGMVELHKEFYPAASASTRSQILKQWKRRGYGPSSIAYSVEKMYQKIKLLDEREKQLVEKDNLSEEFWKEKDKELVERENQATEDMRRVARQEEVIKNNKKHAKSNQETAQQLRVILAQVRRKYINDVCARDWEAWIHEEFTQKEIAQLGL